MEPSEDKSIMRARDFWAALILMAVSVFFLWRTADIPLFNTTQGGVAGVAWYNSAAIVPLGIFLAMLVLSVVLLVVAIRAGGAQRALTAVGLGWDRDEALRFATLAVIFLSYIAALVPRVDFIICSGLLITALIYGYHEGRTGRMTLAAGIMALAGAAAMVLHFPQSEWSAHGDDWIALVLWIGLTCWMLWNGHRSRVFRITPWIAVGAPLILVCAMAFGFRQNVPNRGGLIFSKIEYHYYVTLRPLWRT
ncbi:MULTISPECIES: hypothetical protein [unclassified Meridianimarinicoccus]|uniref:hypothetical protein n=1 Tax=unclassified Meridianimarinicoccus TaxID=2923344 RepID=UPI001D01853D|nr:hypothetical protein [Fluviibacterium sp. MJW13]